MSALPRFHPCALACLAVFLLISGWAPIVSGKDQVIRIGGARGVTAVISTTSETYRVVVEMLPVKAFDPATNKRLNLQKARAYAFQALAKHLARVGPTQFTVRGVEVRESITSGDSYRLALVIPRNGVVVRTAEQPKPRTPEERSNVEDGTRDARSRRTALARKPSGEEEAVHFGAPFSAADLLSRKADHLDTLDRLKQDFLEDLRIAQKELPQQDDFYSSIGDMEERLGRVSKSMTAELNEDKLLLSVEQQELRQALEKYYAEVMEAMKAAVKQFDLRQSTMKKEQEK